MTSQRTSDSKSKHLMELSDDVGSLWSGKIAILETPPSSLEFLRDYVSASRPCLIRNAIPPISLPTTTKISKTRKDDPKEYFHLTLDDLVELSDSFLEEELMLTVDVTPDGHGDTVRPVMVSTSMDDSNANHSYCKWFIKPEQRCMSIRQFRSQLRQSQRLSNTKSHSSDFNIDIDTDIDTDVDEEEGRRVPMKHSELPPYPIHSSHPSNKSINTNISKTSLPPILYYSLQNNCLRTECQTLFSLTTPSSSSTNSPLFPQSFAFAEEAFDTGPPDAINLWIGNELSISSMHKDHYENLFYVASGEKVFSVCPPADIPFLYEGSFRSGSFQYHHEDDEEECDDGNGYWTVIPDEMPFPNESSPNTNIRWIEPDITDYPFPNPNDKHRHTKNNPPSSYPNLQNAHPISIHVKEGEMLYLPALWFHRVTQTCETVGINYWYDMKFDSKWCYFNFLQNISHSGTSNEE